MDGGRSPNTPAGTSLTIGSPSAPFTPSGFFGFTNGLGPQVSALAQVFKEMGLPETTPPPPAKKGLGAGGWGRVTKALSPLGLLTRDSRSQGADGERAKSA